MVPAGMYAGQVWGNEYIKEGKKLASDLQVQHMSFLKSMLGVKRTTANWAFLRECGHELLQFYWFRSVQNAYGAVIPLCKQCGRAFLFLSKSLLMTSGTVTGCEQCGEMLRE
eukprot:768949-Pelagomonas_calceolata.AAC.1